MFRDHPLTNAEVIHSHWNIKASVGYHGVFSKHMKQIVGQHQPEPTSLLGKDWTAALKAPQCCPEHLEDSWLVKAELMHGWKALFPF